MTNVIVAFSKPEDAKSIKHILMRSGFQVVAVCTSGAQALNCLDGLNGGVLVSGYRFEDMLFREIFDCLPDNFRMLLVANPARLSGNVPGDVVCLPMPLKVHDLVSTLEMMIQAQMRLKKKQKAKARIRNEEERQWIAQAKALLMERNNMTEAEAHRYIQKCSMDSGTNMVETAQMVMSLINV